LFIRSLKKVLGFCKLNEVQLIVCKDNPLRVNILAQNLPRSCNRV